MAKFLFVCNDCNLQDLEVPEGFKTAGIKDEHAVNQNCYICKDSKFKEGKIILILPERA